MNKLVLFLIGLIIIEMHQNNAFAETAASKRYKLVLENQKASFKRLTSSKSVKIGRPQQGNGPRSSASNSGSSYFSIGVGMTTYSSPFDVGSISFIGPNREYGNMLCASSTGCGMVIPIQPYFTISYGYIMPKLPIRVEATIDINVFRNMAYDKISSNTMQNVIIDNITYKSATFNTTLIKLLANVYLETPRLNTKFGDLSLFIGFGAGLAIIKNDILLSARASGTTTTNSSGTNNNSTNTTTNTNTATIEQSFEFMPAIDLFLGTRVSLNKSIELQIKCKYSMIINTTGKSSLPKDGAVPGITSPNNEGVNLLLSYIGIDAAILLL